MSGSWRVALRLAWRDVTGHRLRTVLTASLVGLPVLFAGVWTALLFDDGDLGFALVTYLPLGLLIVLLSIPAFGVTARARRDQLDLLESTGGTSADAHRTITAVGLVTGALGVVGGLVLAVPVWLGFVAAINGLDSGQHLVASLGDLALWPLLALVGLGASAVAANITARTASRGAGAGTDDAPSGTWLWTGVGLAVLGALGVVGARGDSVGIAPWTTVLAVGVSLMVPTIVHVTGRRASVLPLAARLATRDADRHRMRTAPAVAAVMAGVAAVTALGIGSYSDNRDGLAEDQIYQFPVGTVSVYTESGTAMPDVVAAAARDDVRLVPLGTPADDDYLTVETSGDLDATIYDSTRFDAVIADADTIAGWGVRLSPAARQALDQGVALAGPTVALNGGELQATLESMGSEGAGRALRMPAVAADLAKERVPAGVRGQLARVVIPPSLATSLGIQVESHSAVVDRRGPAPTDRQLDRLRDVRASSVDVQGTNPFAGYAILFTLLTLLGVGIVGLATATAVALARLDGREDADTLVSVGARPSTSRWVAGFSALLIGGLGSILGVAVGVVPGLKAALALTGGYGGQVVAIPWALLAIVGLGIPLLVAVIAFATASVRPDDPSPSLR